MAKRKSAIIGEYIIQIEESAKVTVYRIYDNVKGSLREIAEKEGFEYDVNWTTQQFGSKLIKALDKGNQVTLGEYVVNKRDNGSIETYRTYDNTKGALREIAVQVGFEYDSNWTTQQFGSKLVDFLNSKE